MLIEIVATILTVLILAFLWIIPAIIAFPFHVLATYIDYHHEESFFFMTILVSEYRGLTYAQLAHAGLLYILFGPLALLFEIVNWVYGGISYIRYYLSHMDVFKQHFLKPKELKYLKYSDIFDLDQKNTKKGND